MAETAEVKVGVYCAADNEVASAIDLEALEKVALTEMKAALYRNHPNLSSAESVEQIRRDIGEHGLSHVVILDRSARAFPGLFEFGPEVMVDLVPLRELVIWTHDANDEDTQMLAEDYLRMYVARTKNLKRPEPQELAVERRVLVIGGGVSGMRSALDIAGAGVPVTLVEKTPALGGWAAKFTRSFPTKPPYDQLQNGDMVRELAERVNGDSAIDVLLDTRVTEINGQPGEFEVKLENGGAPQQLRAGSIVQATGWRPYNPERLGELGYGKKNVVTNVQLEQMFANGSVLKADGTAPKSIAFIQCAGSRDKEHLPYCSGVCCRASLKHAMQLREMYPGINVYVLYKDIRSPAQYELFYQKAQDDPGFFFTKGEVQRVDEKDGVLAIDLDETLLDEPITVEAEMLVLATGIVPTTSVEDGVFAPGGGEENKPDTRIRDEREEGEVELELLPSGKKVAAGAEKGAKILNLTYRLGTDLPTLKYGFPDSHFICFPYETRRTGIFAAGCVRAPMDQAQAMMDANGASLKAVQALEMTAHGQTLHPRSRDLSYPDFFLQRCTQCKRCTEDCPFGALDEDEKGTPLPNLARCRRCGTCMGACPERIVNFQNFNVPMGNSMIKAVEVPEELEEKPRLIAFVCENDALPALEIAARRRMKFNPWVRIVPVRCLGSVNTVWLTNCLDAGFDGIMLLGCKHGDNYQCHFVRGSELAEYRMENVQEKLQQMQLEQERVQVSAVAIDEWASLPELFDDYYEQIEEIGPNPFKDF
ncbi:MAG: Ferredoxin--NADP reductase [Calditrichaeota bacterium]|nr:Ferredoxin--NADP reductase [Calditrichota bacterium]